MSAKSLLQNLGVLIALFTPALYSLGLAYNESYMYTFGISDSLFPLAADKAIFLGFHAFTNATSPRPNLVWFVLAAIVGFLFLFGYISFIRKSENGKLSTWLMYIGYSTRFFTGILVLMLVLSFQYEGSLYGVEIAKGDIAKFEKRQGMVSKIQVDATSAEFDAMPIQCRDTLCAFWTGTSSTIVDISNIKSYITQNNPSTTPQK